ncbi:MAG TPA: hypothetical protein VHA56_19055 [Mucilaginibacter sp.]|nr:hypothetical protein [Mucilaginibacter sp.]
MKKITLGVLAVVFASASVIANVPVHAKKAAKQATCTSCPKGQKCTKSTCDNPSDCCK